MQQVCVCSISASCPALPCPTLPTCLSVRQAPATPMWAHAHTCNIEQHAAACKAGNRGQHNVAANMQHMDSLHRSHHQCMAEGRLGGAQSCMQAWATALLNALCCFISQVLLLLRSSVTHGLCLKNHSGLLCLWWWWWWCVCGGVGVGQRHHSGQGHGAFRIH
jgi:hypothetical protein